MEQEGPTASALGREQAAAVKEVVSIAAVQAGNALARLSGKPVRISTTEVRNEKIRNIPDLFGGAGAPALGVLVPFRGDLEGNSLLLFPEEGIGKLEAMLFPQPDGSPQDLRLSAFAEIGNILTGALLTVLSSLSERVIVSLPPLLVQDMAGAIIDAALAEAGTRSDEVTILVFRLTDPGGTSLVESVLVPGSAGVELFLEAAARLRAGT